jgi:hypothetical protein
MTTKKEREEDKRRRQDQEKRLQVQERADRLEALLGGEVWTDGSVGVILTIDQVDALLATVDDQVTSAYERGTWAGQESANP